MAAEQVDAPPSLDELSQFIQKSHEFRLDMVRREVEQRLPGLIDEILQDLAKKHIECEAAEVRDSMQSVIGWRDIHYSCHTFPTMAQFIAEAAAAGVTGNVAYHYLRESLRKIKNRSPRMSRNDMLGMIACSAVSLHALERGLRRVDQENLEVEDCTLEREGTLVTVRERGRGSMIGKVLFPVPFNGDVRVTIRDASQAKAIETSARREWESRYGTVLAEFAVMRRRGAEAAASHDTERNET